MRKKSDAAEPKRVRAGEFVSIFKRGDWWHCAFSKDGVPHRRALKTKSMKQARLLALGIERELVLGELKFPGRCKTKIAEAIDNYMETLRAKKRKPRTIAKYDHCFFRVRSLAQQLGRERLDQIDLRFIDEYVKASTADGREAKTTRNDLVTVKQLMAWALSRKYLQANPIASLRFEKVRSKQQPCWSEEERERILKAAEGHRYYPILLFLADTGCRVGEAIWLDWPCVDLTPGQEVARIAAKDDWAPKTGDERAIPLSPRLVACLKKQAKSYRWCFTAQPSLKVPVRGRQVDARRLLVYLKRILKKLKLPGHLHTMRHTFISIACLKGVPEAIVRKWVGHVDRATMERYLHIASRNSREEMERLARRLGENGKTDSGESD